MTQEDFTGSISIFAGTYAPEHFYICDGDLKPISANEQLYAIIGTAFGGDGRTTLGLPDLRGRSTMGAGNGPGLTSRRIGEKAGTETTEVTLNANNLPPHTHAASFDAANLNGLATHTIDWSGAAIDVDLKCNPGVGGNGPENCYPGFNDISLAWSPTANATMAPNIITNASLTSMAVQTSFTNTVPISVHDSGSRLSMDIYDMAPFTVLNYVIMHDGAWPERD